MQIAPKEDELKSLQGYSGTLGALSPPERFLVMLARIPRVVEKIKLLLLRRTFKVNPLPFLTPPGLPCICSPSTPKAC